MMWIALHDASYEYNKVRIINQAETKLNIHA